MKAKIMSMMTFLVLGLILSVGSVVVTTLLDHTLHSADDVRTKIGARVLAVVPEGHGRRGIRRAAKPARAAKKPKETEGRDAATGQRRQRAGATRHGAAIVRSSGAGHRHRAPGSASPTPVP